MNISTVLASALASAALALLAGCSGGSSTTASLPATGGLTQTQQMHVQTLLHPELLHPGMTGIAPKFWGLVHPSSRLRCRSCVDDLFVADGGLGDVEILENVSYTDDGTIHLGLNSVEGDFVDKQGNLYVADNAGHRIQEYKPGGSVPLYTYSAGMDQPVQVSVDSHGNVYEADYSTHYYGVGGWVNEYKQGTNSVEYTCNIGGPVAGVAVDSSGDVFISANIRDGSIVVWDYKNGLNGCQSSINFDIPGAFSGGMVIDANRNLILADQKGQIDVIYPPYSQVNYVIHGFGQPFGLALAQNNKTLYVADLGTGTVKVLKYPSAVLITTLGSGNGLSVPFGVTDYPNAVY
jgi:DNA-binding beta-propeller fold protein YncE